MFIRKSAIILALTFWCMGVFFFGGDLSASAASEVNYTLGKTVTVGSGKSNTNYKFTLKDSGTLTFYLNGPYSNMIYSLKDIKGNIIYRTDGSKSRAKTVYTVKKGDYVLNIWTESSSSGYDFKIAQTSARESFPETGADDTKSGANLIKLNNSYRGQLAVNDNSDNYKFKLTNAGGVKFNFYTKMGGCKIKIVGSSGKVYFSDTYAEGGVSNKSILPKGTYYFIVEKVYNTGNYAFSFKTYDSSQSIKLSKTSVKGFQNGSLRIYPKLLRGDGKLTYKSSNTSVCTVDSTGKITFKGAGKATVTVSVSATKAYSSAKRTITVICAPTATSKVNGVCGLGQACISWAGVYRADGYVIKYADNASFKNAKKVFVGKSITEKTLKLKSGRTYFFKVVAYKTINGVKVYGKPSVTIGGYVY